MARRTMGWAATVRRCAGVALAASVAVCGAACGATQVGSPNAVMHSYAVAVMEGRADDAYAMLSDDTRRAVSKDAFRLILKANRDEAIELGRALSRPSSDPYVTARVPLPNGDVITMVLEDGRWRVDGSAIDFYSQASPRQAVAGFVRAFQRRRYDVLLRYTPASHREGLTEDRLKDAWAEGKPEGKRVAEKVDLIGSALATAPIEETGDTATMKYPGGVVGLVREQGAWKVEDL